MHNPAPYSTDTPTTNPQPPQHMETVTVNHKEFVHYIGAGTLQERVQAIGAQLNQDFADKNPLFVSVLNGSFIFAADLMRVVSVRSEVSFVKVKSYTGTESTGKIKELIGFGEELRGRHIVIVEDIVDSGHTMRHILEQLKGFEPASVNICVLLFKPNKLQVKGMELHYVGFEIPDAFVVGYGLDYDGYGRNLPHIYQLKA